MTSRDGLNWDRRFPQAFIRPGREKRNWYNRTNMTSTGVVSTGDDEISLYVLRHYKFPSIHMERMVLRTDGFVSLNAGYGGGEVVTKPLTFKGSNLVLNFATSAAGSIHPRDPGRSGTAVCRLRSGGITAGLGRRNRAHRPLGTFPRRRHLKGALEADRGQTGPAASDDEGRRPLFATVSVIWMRPIYWPMCGRTSESDHGDSDILRVAEVPGIASLSTSLSAGKCKY